MALTLELAQTVAIGAFNPSIITPDWLVRFGVYPKEGEYGVRLVPLDGGVAFDFEVESGSVQWQVDLQRLSVSTSDPGFDCGQAISRVLKLLPHTPVQAIGHNFHFSMSREEWEDRPAPMLGHVGLASFPDAEQVRWGGVFRLEGVRAEVSLIQESEAVAILFNHHRAIDLVKARQEPNADGQIAPAREAAGQFQADFQASREMFQKLFEMETLE